MSPTFPGSSEPWVSDQPRDAAALIVDATRTSSIDMRRLTQARCIVNGCKQKRYQKDLTTIQLNMKIVL